MMTTTNLLTFALALFALTACVDITFPDDFGEGDSTTSETDGTDDEAEGTTDSTSDDSETDSSSTPDLPSDDDSTDSPQEFACCSCSVPPVCTPWNDSAEACESSGSSVFCDMADDVVDPSCFEGCNTGA